MLSVLDNQQLELQSMEYEEQVNELISESKSYNTKKAYQSDWLQFVDWCNINRVSYMPTTPNILCKYVASLANNYKYSSIRRKITSISEAHNASNEADPTKDYRLNAVLKGVSAKYGRQQTHKNAVLLDDLPLMIHCINTDTLAGKRDKALLLIGFSMACRRSEIASIDFHSIKISKNGMEVTFKNTKTTDNDIIKAVVNINSIYCPIKALEDYLQASGIVDGAIFRGIDKVGRLKERLTEKSIAEIVKKYAKLAGFDPALYAGHSLRSGLATSGSEEGYNDTSLMKQGGWKSRGMLDVYVQDGNRFKNNVSAILRKL